MQLVLAGLVSDMYVAYKQTDISWMRRWIQPWPFTTRLGSFRHRHATCQYPEDEPNAALSFESPSHLQV